jgi:hypothetical protein
MSATAKKLFDDISQFIAESQALLEKGAMMELGGLDKNIKSLCDAVLKLSQEDRLKYADKLQGLYNDLTVLGEKLAAKRDSVATDIRHLADHKKALSAYHIADSRDGFGKKDEDKK